jgi:hypothetical protein
VGALQRLVGLLEYLFEEGLTSDVIALDLPHLVGVALEFFPGEQHLVAVLADHLEHHDQVLEVADVVNGEVQLGVPEVPHAGLEVAAASRAAEQFGADPHAAVDGAIGDWRQGSAVELESTDLCLGDMEDVARGKNRKVDGFSA